MSDLSDLHDKSTKDMDAIEACIIWADTQGSQRAEHAASLLKQMRFEFAIKDAAVKRVDEVNAKLRAAVKAAYDWLDAFGQHAPIEFGGEQELSDILCAALEERETDSTYTRESDADPGL